MRQAYEKGLHQFFKLQTTFTTSSMVLFDANGCLRRYDDVTDIMNEFFELRQVLLNLELNEGFGDSFILQQILIRV